ncbi:MAG: hypothetical protein ACI90U_001501 [Pseudomonadales bacterium]|jgi:hypothetical protein
MAFKTQRAWSDTIDFYRYPIVRLWTSAALGFFDWRDLTLAIKPYALILNFPLNIEAQTEQHKGPAWDLKYIKTLGKFDSFVSELSVKDVDYSIRYMHFTFTHFPIDFDENCNYRSDDEQWHKSNQNEQGLKSQATCAVKKWIGFIDKLKELEIYKNSLIVFKSDHGEPASYFSKPPHNTKINGNNKWGYNRYRPTLMIKNFNTSQLRIDIKEELVLLNDLAKTLCEEPGVGVECHQYNGINLFDSPLETTEPYYLYVPRDSSSSHKHDTHISVKIPTRKESLLAAMERSPKIKLFNPATNTHNIQKTFIEVKDALQLYFNANGGYPVSSGWQGICSKWGKSTPEYIKGLVPEYLQALPVDFRENKKCGVGYFYKSNGKGYKFLLFGATREHMKHVEPEFIDPNPKRRSFGIWTDGAKNW